MKSPFALLLFCLSFSSFGAGITLEQQNKLGIRTSPLIADDVVVHRTFHGQVKFSSNSQQTLSKSFNLQVKKWLVAVGDQVTQGQAICDIYVPEMVELEHEYHRLLSAVQLAKQKQQREQNLITQGIVSQKQYQQTQAELIQLLEQLDSFRNQLALIGISDADFALLNQNPNQHLNGKLTLKSPTQGKVAHILVGVNQSLPMNTNLVTLLTNQSLQVHIPIPPALAQGLQIGQVLHLEDGSPAKLQSIGQQVSDAQKIIVVATLDHPSIKAGQWVNVQFPESQEVRQWRVSRQSITYTNNQPHLIALTQGELSLIPVELVTATREGWVVTGEGLTEQTQLVISGTAAAKAILSGE